MYESMNTKKSKSNEGPNLTPPEGASSLPNAANAVDESSLHCVESPIHSSTSQHSRGDQNDDIQSKILNQAKKLLDQVSPEMRQQIVDKVKTQGPAASLTFVAAASKKTRNLKVKFILSALAMILRVFVK